LLLLLLLLLMQMHPDLRELSHLNGELVSLSKRDAWMLLLLLLLQAVYWCVNRPQFLLSLH
jgi:hypothetical protein